MKKSFVANWNSIELPARSRTQLTGSSGESNRGYARA
jgi:hypothetical protein